MIATKHIKMIIFLVLSMITLMSCDITRLLVIKAANNPSVSVTIYANSKILPYRNDGTTEKIVIKIPESNTSTKRDTMFLYGLGCWANDSLMRNFSRNIDSIVIVNSNNTIILDNQNEINAYLLKKRHGFAKSILTIEAQ